MRLPRLYLDVDGVLNAWAATPETIESRGLRSHEILGYTLHVDHAIVEELCALPVDIWWATTWMDRANHHLCPAFGMAESYPFIGPIDGFARKRGLSCGKPVPRSCRDFDGPVIWIDDELGPADYEWAAQHHAPTLLIQPYGDHGLTQRHMAAIRDFVFDSIVAA